MLLVLILLSLGFSACKSDPYAKMSMSVSTTLVELSLTEVNKELQSNEKSVDVTIDAPNGVSRDIVLPRYGNGYGDEYVDIKVAVVDNGSYTLTLTARKQGKTEFQIKTLEGYLAKTIAVDISVPITGIEFKPDAKAVVEI